MFLDQLAVHYGTDKSSADHNYCPLYEHYLAGMRDEPITLLELGVWKGSSLMMWHDYFPNARILGLDNNLRNFTYATPSERFMVCEGEQDDPWTIDRLAELGPFDVIIDDASHLSSKTIRSFQLLYPHLKPVGLYVIEDLQTSYDVTNYGRVEASTDPNAPPWDAPDRLTAMQFCKGLADEVNSCLFPEVYSMGYDLASVQFFANICFITKGGGR